MLGLWLTKFLPFSVISPRILRIMIVNVVRRCSSSSSFVVRCNAFLCHPMISLNGWRYVILIKTKKLRLDLTISKQVELYFWVYFIKCYKFDHHCKHIPALLARGFWESWRGIMIVHVVRRRRRSSSSFVRRRSFVVDVTLFPCPPHDFSERLKIWNFDKIKKVAPRCVDVQEKKKIPKKNNFLDCGVISAENFSILCPPMISLNGWRYEILIKTKKLRLDV